LDSYRIVCPACSSEFLSYEKYVGHVFESHGDQPSLRMKAIIRKEEEEEEEEDSQNCN
jgi:uncharacterized C2H2 Zn-finger protein